MLNVIDLFCGCGGLSLGFKLAGYNIVGGIDFNKEAIETFNTNFENAKGICFDLFKMDNSEIINTFGELKNIDVIIGGPPCQGFSSANRYKKEEEDDRNKLFFEFVKFVDLADPKAIVIENVRGIVTSNNGYAKDRIEEIFKSRGYKVSQMVLDASIYGVPQKRLRNFFVMTKNVEFDFNTMEKQHNIITVKEALEELYEFDKSSNVEEYIISIKPKTEYQKYLRNDDDIIYNHEIKYPADIVQERISHVHQGNNWREIPEELFDNKRKNRHSSAFKRLDEENTSVTIDTGNAHSNYFHPIYNRIPTVREAARIQSFSDSFIFKGSRTSQYRQVGNAVPPLLSKAIAVALKEIISDGEK